MAALELKLAVGEVITRSRTFTVPEVEAWTRLIGDAGTHHVAPDPQGRLMVHGLLTGSLGTSIGGELAYLARTMTFHFKRPVWTGDTITCRLELTRVEEKPGRVDLEMAVTYTNQHGEVVLEGTSTGLVRR